MNKYEKNYYRCGYCDVAFTDHKEFSEHFDSGDHAVERNYAFNIYFAKLIRNLPKTESIQPK